MENEAPHLKGNLSELADHVERIALIIADGKSHRRPALDARFLVLAADALRELGGQVAELAKIGHELKNFADSAGDTNG